MLQNLEKICRVWIERGKYYLLCIRYKLIVPPQKRNPAQQIVQGLCGFFIAYFPNVNRAVKPMAAGSKLISLTILSSGFQSSEMFKGALANL